MNTELKIKLRGHLDPRWEDWFDGLEFIPEGHNTTLQGYAGDEVFIHKILIKIRDLNLKLISVDINQ